MFEAISSLPAIEMGVRRARSLSLVAALVIGGAGYVVPANAAALPDAWITTRVKMALLVAEDVPATAVSVDTTDGNVTLHGIVSNAGEKSRAERAAKNVPGVREVRDLVQVVEKPLHQSEAVADEALSVEVQARLGADPVLRESQIEVKSVNNGAVLLGGKAETLTAHLHALEVAREVPGVRRVMSEIASPDSLADDEIWRDAGSEPESPASSAATDAWITTASKVRLMANSVTPAFDINVDTRQGIVTLFGTVPTEAVRSEAEIEVRKIDSVRGVNNDLQIVPHVTAAAVEQQDDRLKEAIEKRLEAREELSDARIDVEVANGVARLTGSVQGQSDRLIALTLARTTGGVRSVTGDLTVVAQ